ncbi:MAG: phosphatidylserine decarboxylase family protein [Acidobacteria bacterium]|nr:phosphatidylserine decarboxylase family protein [Acidobacteriota bacterium]
MPPLFFGGIALALHWWITAGILIALALFCFSFFRDPDRVIPTDPDAVVSPADGRVVVITEEENAGRAGTRISVFLAIWNVHVNRTPLSGAITQVKYLPGKFLAAWDPKASTQNEQNVFTLATAGGDIEFKQIAGLVARRCVSWKREGDRVERGERIGLVRFGSRVDVWLPREAQISVKVGDTVHGGSSILARWSVQSSNASSDVALAEAGQSA